MIVYFETSAFVKLFISEPGSDAAALVWDRAERVTSSALTYVETRAALAAAQRSGRVSASAYAVAKGQLELAWREIEAIAVRNEIVEHAGDLAERHALRGYDALHLASCVVATDLLATFDHELARAASGEGLHVSIS